MMDHSSSSRFSMGVPVRASLQGAFSLRTALAWALPAFLMAWASSTTTRPQERAAKISSSRRTTP